MSPQQVSRIRVYLACLLLAVPSLASAQHEETAVSLVGGSNLSEPCLAGDPETGLCAGERNDENFGGRQSILRMIRDDLRRVDGAAAEGEFVKVSDQDDQLWQVLSGSEEMLVGVRARFQKHDYAFGLAQRENPEAALLFTTLLDMVQVETLGALGALHLSSCENAADFSPTAERCLEYNENAPSFYASLAGPEQQKFAFAIANFGEVMKSSMLEMFDASSDPNVAKELQPRESLVTSSPALNYEGADQMVTYRFTEKVRTINGEEPRTIYILAFMDSPNVNGANTGFNDFVVEIALAEPAGADVGGAAAE